MSLPDPGPAEFRIYLGGRRRPADRFTIGREEPQPASAPIYRGPLPARILDAGLAAPDLIVTDRELMDLEPGEWQLVRDLIDPDRAAGAGFAGVTVYEERWAGERRILIRWRPSITTLPPR